MKILGALGFDWKIFLVQALNFLILFLILRKIFFKPFIAALQKEKNKNKEMLENKANISQQKDILKQEKEAEINEAKKEAQKIIKEAKKIAEQIKKRTIKEAEEEKMEIIRQAKSRLKEIKDEQKS